MKKEISGCAKEQVTRWMSASGHEPFSSWARRHLDEAAALTEREAVTAPPRRDEPIPRVNDSGEGDLEGSPASRSVSAEKATLAGGERDGVVAQSVSPLGHVTGVAAEPPPPASVAQQVAAPGVTTTPSALKTSAGPGASSARKQGGTGAATKTRARTKMCEHRVPAGTWCKRCDP